jgi:hypothetical protein
MLSHANPAKVVSIAMMMLWEICSNTVMITSVQLATIAHQERGYLSNVWQVLIQTLVSAIDLLL